MTHPSDDPPARVLADRLDQLGVTQSALSKASGKSRNTIAKALAGHPQVRPATFDDLFRVLDSIEAGRQPGVPQSPYDPEDTRHRIEEEVRAVIASGVTGEHLVSAMTVSLWQLVDEIVINQWLQMIGEHLAALPEHERKAKMFDILNHIGAIRTPPNPADPRPPTWRLP